MSSVTVAILILQISIVCSAGDELITLSFLILLLFSEQY